MKKEYMIVVGKSIDELIHQVNLCFKPTGGIAIEQD